MNGITRTLHVLVLATLAAVPVLGAAGPPPAGAGAKSPLPAAAARRRGAPPFRAVVDMATFMEHVLTPAATVIWRTNGFVNDASGEHDLSPKTEQDWELVVSGAATLAEATNALMIPERALDRDWNGYVQRLADIAEQAYQAAEKHDLRAIWQVSDRLDAVCSACHQHYGLE